MRAIVFAGVLATAGSLLASPQSAEPQRVVIEVAALDRDGNPVPGLALEDFRVKVGGKAQPVRRVTSLQATSTSATSGRAVLSNSGPGVTQRVIVLAIDDLSFPAEAGRRLLAAAARFAGEQSADTLVGLTTTSGRVILNPTTDQSRVMAALAGISGQYRDPRKSSVANAASISLVEAIEMVEHNNQAVIDAVRQRECGGTGRGPVGAGVYANAVANYNEACANEAMRAARAIATDTRETVDRQTSGLARAFDAMARVGGLKQMLLVSAGIATTRPASALRPVASAAARAGARLSVVTEDLDAVDVSDSGHTLNDLGAVTYTTGVSGRHTDDRAMLRSSLQALAEFAGGTFDLATGTDDAAFARAGRSASVVYRLAIDRTPDMPASGTVEVEVSTAREGVVVRANRLARLDSDARTAARDADGVPVRLAVVRRQAADARVELGVAVAVPPGVPAPLTLTIGLVDEQGLLKQGTRPMLPAVDGGYALTLPMAVEAGLYALRVSVTDAKGRTGDLESNIEARVTSLGPVRTSDLLTWWVDERGNAQLFAMDELPAGVAAVWAGLELYAPAGGAMPSSARVTMSVSAPDGRAVSSVDASLRSGRDRIRAEAALPVGEWPAGAYRVTAQVTVEGRVVGSTSALLRKR